MQDTHTQAILNPEDIVPTLDFTVLIERATVVQYSQPSLEILNYVCFRTGFGEETHLNSPSPEPHYA